MNTLYDFEDIDDYVKGRMSDADRAAFEAAVAADPQLALKVEALRAEADVLRGLRREALFEKLGEWEQEIPAKPRIVPLWQQRWMQAAAAVAAILVVWALWPDFQTKPSDTGIVGQPGLQDSSDDKTASGGLEDSLKEGSEKNISPVQKPAPAASPYAEIAARNFNADYASINLMGEPDLQIINNQLQLAAEAIEHKQYDRALALLRKIPASNPDDYEAILDDYFAAKIMTGDVYFLQKKFALAEKAYSEPAQSEKDKFRDVAQWHLLLTYLAVYPQKTGDFERTMSAILNDPDHPYMESARRIQLEMSKE